MCQGNGGGQSYGQNPYATQSYGQQPYQSFQAWQPQAPTSPAMPTTGGVDQLAPEFAKPMSAPVTGGIDQMPPSQMRPQNAVMRGGQMTNPQAHRMRLPQGMASPKDGPDFTPWQPGTQTPPPGVTPNQPGMKPPMPTGPMQPGQQKWTYRPDIINGGFGASPSWQPQLGNGQYAYLVQALQKLNPDQHNQIDRNNILESVGNLSGMKYNPTTFG